MHVTEGGVQVMCVSYLRLETNTRVIQTQPHVVLQRGALKRCSTCTAAAGSSLGAETDIAFALLAADIGKPCSAWLDPLHNHLQQYSDGQGWSSLS